MGNLSWKLDAGHECRDRKKRGGKWLSSKFSRKSQTAQEILVQRHPFVTSDLRVFN